MHKFPPFSRENALLILVHYYPNIRRTAASIKFQELFNLSSENIIKINRLDSSAFNKIKKDTHIIKNEVNLITDETIYKKPLKLIKQDTHIIKNEVNLINDDKYLFNFNNLHLNLNDENIYKKPLNNIKTDTHIINKQSKFTVINLGMGEGKTAQTIDYLKMLILFLDNTKPGTSVRNN